MLKSSESKLAQIHLYSSHLACTTCSQVVAHVDGPIIPPFKFLFEALQLMGRKTFIPQHSYFRCIQFLPSLLPLLRGSSLEQCLKPSSAVDFTFHSTHQQLPLTLTIKEALKWLLLLPIFIQNHADGDTVT